MYSGGHAPKGDVYGASQRNPDSGFSIPDAKKVISDRNHATGISFNVRLVIQDPGIRPKRNMNEKGIES